MYHSLFKKDKFILLHFTRICVNNLLELYPQLTIVVCTSKSIKVLCKNGVSTFENHTLTEVLKLLVNKKYVTISSSSIHTFPKDYLTDQYIDCTYSRYSSQNILQSLVVLGCSKGTLWCSKKTWKHILEQNKLIHRFIESKEWLFKGTEVRFI